MVPLPRSGCCKVTLEVLNSGNDGAKALYLSEGFVFEVCRAIVRFVALLCRLCVINSSCYGCV